MIIYVSLLFFILYLGTYGTVGTYRYTVSKSMLQRYVK